MRSTGRSSTGERSTSTRLGPRPTAVAEAEAEAVSAGAAGKSWRGRASTRSRSASANRRRPRRQPRSGLDARSAKIPPRRTPRPWGMTRRMTRRGNRTTQIRPGKADGVPHQSGLARIMHEAPPLAGDPSRGARVCSSKYQEYAFGVPSDTSPRLAAPVERRARVAATARVATPHDSRRFQSPTTKLHA